MIASTLRQWWAWRQGINSKVLYSNQLNQYGTAPWENLKILQPQAEIIIKQHSYNDSDACSFFPIQEYFALESKLTRHKYG
ncbi:hypothetical protein [Halpernia sp. GG3]